jgi:hypothetical protein
MHLAGGTPAGFRLHDHQQVEARPAHLLPRPGSLEIRRWKLVCKLPLWLALPRSSCVGLVEKVALLFANNIRPIAQLVCTLFPDVADHRIESHVYQFNPLFVL